LWVPEVLHGSASAVEQSVAVARETRDRERRRPVSEATIKKNIAFILVLLS